jgi:hypothetical protein
VQVTVVRGFTCTLSSAGTFRTCTDASVRATFGQSFTNQLIVALTGPSFLNATQTVTGTSATFTWTPKSSTAACPPTQFDIAFYRDIAQGTPVARTSTSIPVTCVG